MGQLLHSLPSRVTRCGNCPTINAQLGFYIAKPNPDAEPGDPVPVIWVCAPCRQELLPETLPTLNRMDALLGRLLKR